MAKKTKEDNEKQFKNELDTILGKSGVQVQSLEDGGKISYWLDTGCLALNWIISNDFFKGIPGARVILISGEPGKGKSFLLDAILASSVRGEGLAYKADIENSANYEFTKLIAGEEIAKQIKLLKPRQGDVIHIEKLTSILNKAIDFQASLKEAERKKVAFGIDSVTQLTSVKELEIVSQRKDDKKDKKDLTAPVKMRELFRSIEQKLPYANMTIIGIGQLTANIPADGFIPPGTPKTVVNVKGSGFKFASSLTINMISDKEILKKKIPIGIKMKMKTMKNRVAFRGRSCWIYFYFNRGIDRLGGLCELLAEFGVFNALVANIDKNTGEVKVDKDGNPKMKKAEPLANGEYKPDVIFKYVTSSGKELLFKVQEFAKTVEENGGDELLKEINERLNNIYQNLLDDAGITEDDMYGEETDYDEEGDE